MERFELKWQNMRELVSCYLYINNINIKWAPVTIIQLKVKNSLNTIQIQCRAYFNCNVYIIFQNVSFCVPCIMPSTVSLYEWLFKHWSFLDCWLKFWCKSTLSPPSPFYLQNTLKLLPFSLWDVMRQEQLQFKKHKVEHFSFCQQQFRKRYEHVHPTGWRNSLRSVTLVMQLEVFGKG